MRPDFAELDRRIQQWIDKSYYPGAAIIIGRGKSVLHERFFGQYEPETVVYLASAGKWLAAATIASVVEDTELDWDDSVEQWLPEFRGQPEGKAKLRQLLSHSSGIRDYQPRDRKRDTYQALSESVEHIVPLEPSSAPGERFEYGGLAMQVAGRMAEVATGKDWETLFQERIAMPLGMTDTHFTPVDEVGGGHAPMLGGGARGTLHDYASFLQMIAANGLFDGRRILSESSIKEMQADQVRGATLPESNYVERARGLTHNGIYGLGQWREIVDEEGNPLLITSPSWAGTYPFIDKQRGVWGFLLTHVDVDSPAVRADNFNAFYSSPIIPELVADAVDSARRLQE